MPDERTPKERIRDAKEALRRIEQGEAPTATELAAAPRLTAWFVIDLSGISALGGTVTGHADHDDKATIITSDLLWLAPDRMAARTVSRFYRLGTPRSAMPDLQ